MKLIALLLTTAAISAAKLPPQSLKKEGGVFKKAVVKLRTPEALCMEEVMAAQIDGDKKREQYFKDCRLKAVIAQFKASAPKSYHAAIDKAPLATAASAYEFAPHFDALLAAGADVCQPNDRGNTPLLFASCQEKFWWVQSLIKRGAAKTINAKNVRGVTALTHFYVAPELSAEQKSVIATLLCNGAIPLDPSTLEAKLQKYVQKGTVKAIQKMAAEAAALVTAGLKK